MADAIFASLERYMAGRSWGAVLDAGTGQHSLEWLCGLDVERWTAVTGAASRADRLSAKLGDRIRAADRIVVGNWLDQGLLAGEVYETVLADYLLGAIDGWAPYFQDQLFGRLRPLVGRRLMVVGMEPPARSPETPGARIVDEIGRLRDACILLAGHHCYREYPQRWVERQLAAAGFDVVESKTLPIVYGERFVNRQLDVCVRKLPHFGSKGLVLAMERHIEEVRQRGLALARSGGIRSGQDYVVIARPR